MPGADTLTKHLICAVISREEGKWSRIPEPVFIDTMKCFTRFVREHFVSYGYYGFDRGFWTTRQVEAKLFRIGEMEYELAEENGKEIHLHIPSDTVLEEERLNDSVSCARLFLTEFYPEWGSASIRMESWLLSPALKELLHPGSRILWFQDAFDLLAWDPEPVDVLEWVFQVASGQQDTVVLSELPEKTSLQRKMKQYLLEGGKIGAGTGILVREF